MTIYKLWLALTIYLEARGEPYEAQKAVGHVACNRSRIRTKNLEEVITEPNQYSWYKEFKKSIKVAEVVFKEQDSGEYFDGVDHHFDNSIPPPSWTMGMTLVKLIGHTYFYRSKNAEAYFRRKEV